MAGFLRELEDEGRVKRLHLPRVTEPDRWILTEEEGLYLTIFGASAASAPEKQQAAATILYRFLETHALVGLRDVLGRYPFEEDWARRTLEDWARGGRLVRLEKPGAPEPLCWSAAANFEQLQRGTLAVLRREVTTCPATQFVDFVLHWQKAHPAARGHGPEGLAETLDRLQGIYLPADLWEQAVLPARIEDYQGRWLDEMLAAGQWLWVGQGGQERGPGQVALLARENVGTLPALVFEETPIDHATEIVYETMQTRGALFVPDLAQATGLTPNNVRAALWSLARRGLATNDHFEVVRRGEDKNTEPPAETQHRMRRGGRVLLRPGTGRRARVGLRPEGRWSLVPWGQPDPENAALSGARRLLQRYGIVAREMALLDAHMPPWRVLYEVLNRLELAGEGRRGYFVEGLSGAQFALPEAARVLRELTLPASGQTAPLLLPSLDPANLYGSGAPFDIPLLEEGTRPFQRRPGNWLVLQACRPILLVEQQGKRLTALPSARPEDLAAAAKLLPGMVGKNQVKDIRHKLRVETWNEKTVTATEGKDFLEAAGFVRDYQAMTWYALWN